MKNLGFAYQPGQGEPIADSAGRVTRVWANYFAKLALTQASDELRDLYLALAERVGKLEDGQALTIIGRDSVRTDGAGQIEIRLVGDENAPGNTEYYGTNAAGEKGFHPVSDAIEVEVTDLTKAVGLDGIITLGLADVPDNGAGTLQAITVDGKGRVTGTKDATITGTAQQIDVANGDASAGLPTLSLAEEVLDALEEAKTALQPGDVAGPNSVKVTPNGSGGIILQLENDVASPAALTAYSVDSAGVRGWYRPALFESTGVINGGALSINAGNNARFDMAQAVIGYTDWSITPSQPTRVLSTVGPFSAQAVANIATANATYVGIQMPAGTIVQQTSPFTNTQRRSIAQIGVLVHSNHTSINAINDQAATIRAGVNQVGDLMAAIGALNLQGNIYSANGANLNINKSAGSIFKMGANFQTSHLDPHVVSLGAQTALTFRYRMSNGAEGADTASINPNQYESAPGVLTNIPILGNQWHVQRINIFQSGLTRIQYGQQLYGSLAAAIQGITTDSFNTEQNIAENGILRCYLVINRGLLGLLGSATFVNVSKFGATQAGGGVVPVHNDLPGLQGGGSGEYYHLTSAQYTGLTPWASVTPASKADASALAALDADTVKRLGNINQVSTANQWRLETNRTAGSYNVALRLDSGAGFNSANGAIFELNGANEPTRPGACRMLAVAGAPISFVTGSFGFNLGSAAGGFVPTADNTHNLGNGSVRWKEVFAGSSVINTSDAREKTPVRPLTAAETAAAAALGDEIGVYQWLAMIESKGSAARQHIGLTVQRAIEVLEAHGVDPFARGFICYDQWDELPEVVNDRRLGRCVLADAPDMTIYEDVEESMADSTDGDQPLLWIYERTEQIVEQEYRPAGDRYSFRMDELLAFIIAGERAARQAGEQAMAAKIEDLLQRLAAAGL